MSARQQNRQVAMSSLTHAIHALAGLGVIYGSKLGVAGMFLFPIAMFLSRSLGDRLLRLYVTVSTATVGILIARLLSDLLHSATAS
jgi:hypothetical protein